MKGASLVGSPLIVVRALAIAAEHAFVFVDDVGTCQYCKPAQQAFDAAVVSNGRALHCSRRAARRLVASKKLLENDNQRHAVGRSGQRTYVLCGNIRVK